VHVRGSVQFRVILACASAVGSFAQDRTQQPLRNVSDVTAYAHTFYVSVGGSDLNPGSVTRPWRTIQHAADSISPGATVEVRTGIYHESVDVKVSGSITEGFITLRSVPGEIAILDGTALPIAENNQRGLFNVHDQSYITIEGFEVRNYGTSKPHRTPAGINISGAGSNINIIGNHIHNITTAAKGSLCSRGRAETADAFGIVVYGTEAPQSLNHLLIQGNEVDHLHTGCSESVVVNGNVRDWSISRNTIHDNDNIGIDAIGFEHVSPDADFDRVRDGTITDNVVYNISSEENPSYKPGDLSADGIYVDGGTSVVIERNRMRQVDIGIEVASEAKGRSSSDIVVRNNLIYKSNSAGISIGGYASDVGGAERCTIVNNTLVENDSRQTESGEFQIQYGATSTVFKNNLVVAGGQNLFVNSYTSSGSSGVVMNANLYYSAGGSEASRWRWTGTAYRGFSSFQSGAGQDRHSFFAEPRFVDRQAEDFRTQSNSPGSEEGEDLGQLLGPLDFAGAARTRDGKVDIGAYQRQASSR
jgi:hypothetical protein